MTDTFGTRCERQRKASGDEYLAIVGREKVGFRAMRDGLCKLPNEEYEIDHFRGPMHAVLCILKIPKAPIPECC